MRDLEALRSRYLRDSIAVQLSGLASNLSRIAWFAQRARGPEAVPVFRESKYFSEWATPACTPDQQALLAEIQRQLASWERGWGNRLSPARIAKEA